MIVELERMVELVGKLPEIEQQNLVRAFLAMVEAYLAGQQVVLLNTQPQTEGSRDRPTA